MKYLLSGSEMKSCDTVIIQKYGVPSLVLMERAALCVAEKIERILPVQASVLLVCGSGNNGGDGLAIARLLYLRGYRVTVVFAGKEASATEETAMQLAIVRNYGLFVHADIPDNTYDMVVDCLFGIGLSREIQGHYRELIRQMNALPGRKLAVDIPSGINADNGHIMGIAFRADITLTMAFAKVGHLLYPGAGYTGTLEICEIGIDEHGFETSVPMVQMIELEDLNQIPKRRDDTNKGDFGKVLIVAGSKNMAGAAVFSAKAAYRTGAGLVQVLTCEENRPIVQTLVPEAVLKTYGKLEEALEELRACLAWASVIVLGPGLGQGEMAEGLVRTVLDQARVPCIVDADALNIIAAQEIDLTKAQAPIIATPHMGEMARLCQTTVTAIKEDPIRFARLFAKKYQVVTVLKDARTIIALPDGAAYVNASGNSGMSTGGSGDVLTGVIAGLYGTGCSVAQSAYLGVYLHGLSGDWASAHLCRESLMASDLIEGITFVLKEGK